MRIVSGFWLLPLLLLVQPAAASGRTAAVVAPEVAGLELNANGTFTIDRIKAFVGHFDRGWIRADQLKAKPDDGYPRRKDQAWDTRVSLPLKNAGSLVLEQRVERLDKDAFRLRYEATRPAEVDSRELFLQLELPVALGGGRTVVLDGALHPLPSTFGKARLFGSGEIRPRTLVLPGASGTVTIEGSFSVLAQDLREWGLDNYAVRLRFSPGSAPTRFSFDATVRSSPLGSSALSLKAAANLGLRDERGAWSDQGPGNDLRSLRPGPLTAAGVSFEILDASANAGRDAIILGKASSDSASAAASHDDAIDTAVTGRGARAPVALPASASVHVSSGAESRTWRSLYLLHATAWTPRQNVPVGHVVLSHADGSEVRHEISIGREVGDWWEPVSLENATVGWASEAARNGGLYVTHVRLEGKPISEIRFETTGSAVWLIAGISVSSDADNVAALRSWTAAAGPEWAEHEHDRDILEGSVFDFSGQLHAPAGSHGPVFVTPEGHFAFRDRPGERVRFWGVNLCYGANFPDKETADRLAENLARSGYNSVRLHHYDREIQKKGGPSWEIDPEMLDRFDYLFAALKKRGLYVSIDLYTSRTFSPEEFAEIGFDPELAKEGTAHWRFKSILPVSDKAFDLWAKFARNLLTHRNPYTGLAWGEDPALIGICPVNEDAPRGRVNSDKVVNRMYRDAFEVWLGDPSTHVIPGVENESRERAFNRFVYDRQIRHNDRLREFLRGLGVQAPLTGTNHHQNQWLAFVRERYDYVDMHPYWDHPTFPGARFQFPLQFRQHNAVKSGARTPRNIMPVRILGKPFAVTEFNFVRPNRYRAEGGVIMPAYAGLQDWDMLYNFDFGPVTLPISVGGNFSIGSDPIGLIADRVGAALFLRGDIEPARGEIAFAVPVATAFTERERAFPDTFSPLGLVTRIGSLATDPETALSRRNPAAVVVEPESLRAGGDRRVYAADEALADNLQRDGVLPRGSISADATRYVSETGQIELRTEPGTLKVVTPRSELFVLPPDETLEGARVSVRNGLSFGTVNVVSVDGESLADSTRLLVTHLTDSLPTGARFAAPDRRLYEERGTLPHLIHRGSAELTLRLADGAWKAWAVSPTGARLREVPLVKTGEGWRLKVETVTAEGTQLAYELLCE